MSTQPRPSHSFRVLGWSRWLVLGAFALFFSVIGCGGPTTNGNICKVNGDCANGGLCISGKCHVADAPQCAEELSPCQDDAACSSGLCQNGCCALLCVTALDCPIGQQCRAGLCEARTLPDGGSTDGCTKEADCSDPTPHCLTSAGECVECRSGADCGAIFRCNEAQTCELRSGRCEKNADCTAAGARVCDVESKQCVQCITNADCPTGEACGVDLVCHPTQTVCTRDSDCKAAATPRCNTSSGRCVQCASDAHCSGAQKCQNDMCVTPTSTACTSGANCSSIQVCAAQENSTNTGFDLSCQPAISGGARGGDACSDDSDCRSGYCYIFGYAPTDGICINACRGGTSGSDCGYDAFCPSNGVALFLPGPNGVYESSSTNSDDVTVAAPICWPETCVSDYDCLLVTSADPFKDRVCMPWTDPTAPSDPKKVAMHCMPSWGTVEGGGRCSSDSDCASGYCITWQKQNGQTRSSCFGACESDWDCAGFTAVCVQTSMTDHGYPVGSCVEPF